MQANASLLFYIRAPKSADVKAIAERVNDIARGAALMTGTSVEITLHLGTNNLLVNEVVGSTFSKAWKEHKESGAVYESLIPDGVVLR